MRTSKRLQEANERLEAARLHAIRARQLLVYDKPKKEVIAAINAAIKELNQTARLRE